MKLVAVALLFLGMLCNSVLAAAEGPVPFRALMRNAGAQPSIPPINDAKDQSTAVSTQPAHTHPMTSGGKIMIGVGIGMVVIGGAALVGAALSQSWPAPAGKEAAAYATGGGLVAGGITLIAFGTHRRSAQ